MLQEEMKKCCEQDFQMLHSSIAKIKKWILSHALNKLNSIVYHEEIGTLAEKVDEFAA